MSSIAEKRRFDRFTVESEIIAHITVGNKNDFVRGKSIDLSYPFVGIKLVVDKAIESITPLQMELVSKEGKLILACQGIVVWCVVETTTQESEKSVYKIGISVSRPDAEAAEDLDLQISARESPYRYG